MTYSPLQSVDQNLIKEMYAILRSSVHSTLTNDYASASEPKQRNPAEIKHTRQEVHKIHCVRQRYSNYTINHEKFGHTHTHYSP